MKDMRRYELGVGLLLVAAAALLAFMALRIGALGSLGDNLRVTAVFHDVAGLKDGAAVTIAGVEVGRVSGLEVDFDAAEVGLLIRRDARVREDVIVTLRSRSVLGEKYIELVPGSPDAPLLEDGEVLTHTRAAADLNQLVDALEPVVQAIDPASLAALVDALARAARDDPERPTRILADLERLVHNAAEASDEAAPLMIEARAAVGVARGTMSELRSVAAEARPVVAKADTTMGHLSDASAALPRAAESLPALVADAEVAASEARELMVVLSSNSDRIETILANVEEIDKWELRRLLREEGIKVRLLPAEVEPEAD